MRLIDRNELEAFGATCKSQDYMDGVKDLLEYIDNLPPVDAQPVRHGKWEPVSEDWRHQIEWWKCSECGFVTYTDYTYCPHCGAKMGEEEDGTDK